MELMAARRQWLPIEYHHMIGRPPPPSSHGPFPSALTYPHSCCRSLHTQPCRAWQALHRQNRQSEIRHTHTPPDKYANSFPKNNFPWANKFFKLAVFGNRRSTCHLVQMPMRCHVGPHSGPVCPPCRRFNLHFMRCSACTLNCADALIPCALACECVCVWLCVCIIPLQNQLSIRS